MGGGARRGRSGFRRQRPVGRRVVLAVAVTHRPAGAPVGGNRVLREAPLGAPWLNCRLGTVDSGCAAPGLHLHHLPGPAHSPTGGGGRASESETWAAGLVRVGPHSALAVTLAVTLVSAGRAGHHRSLNCRSCSATWVRWSAWRSRTSSIGSGISSSRRGPECGHDAGLGERPSLHRARALSSVAGQL